jgi:hypothetical protein
LDISVNPLSKDMLFTADLASIQASLYAGIIQHYNQIAKAYQYGITFWELQIDTVG